MCVYNISTCDEPVRGLQCLVNLCMAQVLTRMRIERLESQCSIGLSLCANAVERAFQNVGEETGCMHSGKSVF